MGKPKRGAILAAIQPKFPHLYLMNHLFQALTVRVDEWRKARYECPDFSAIGEILDFALEDPATDQLRYLRRAQFRALETYLVSALGAEHPAHSRPVCHLVSQQR